MSDAPRDPSPSLLDAPGAPGAIEDRLARNLLILTCVLAFFGAVLGSREVLSGTHETRVVETAREMQERGTWVTPWYCGEHRLQKPPLPYWLAMISWGIAGENTLLAARTGVGLLAIVTLLASFVLMRGVATRLEAAASCAVLASGFLFLNEFRILTPDCVLAATVALTLAFFARSARADGEAAVRLAMAGWFALGLALLAKGPIAIAYVAIGLLAFRGTGGRLLCPRGWGFGVGLALFPVAFWIWQLLPEAPEAPDVWFFEVGQAVGQEQSQRSSRNFLRYTGPLLKFLAPWTLFLVLLFRKRALGGGPARVAFVLGLLFLATITRQKASYLLPLAPFAALFVGQGLVRSLAARHPSPPERRLLRLHVLLFALLPVVVGGLAVREVLRGEASPALAISGLIPVTVALGFHLQALSRGTPLRRLATALMVALCGMIGYFGVVRSRLPDDAPLRHLADRVARDVSEDVPYVALAPLPARVCFYSRRIPRLLSPGEVPPPGALVICNRAALQRWPLRETMRVVEALDVDNDEKAWILLRRK